MIFSVHNLLNNSSKAMNVNGVSASKTFSYSPGEGNSAGIIGLCCLMKDEGTTSFSNFAGISSLANGVLIQITKDGVTRQLTTIQDNSDLCTRFHFNQFGSGAVLSLLGLVTAEGFGESNKVFMGYMDFNIPIILNGSDSISAVVQDDLRNVDLLQMSCKVQMD